VDWPPGGVVVLQNGVLLGGGSFTYFIGTYSSKDGIFRAEQCSVRHVNMTISLAFLAPKLVRAAVEGRLPRGINIERLRDAPAEWSRQFEALGLSPPQ